MSQTVADTLTTESLSVGSGVDEGIDQRHQWPAAGGLSARVGTLPEHVDAVHEEVGQGPCLDAANEHLTVRVAGADITSRRGRRAPPRRLWASCRLTSAQQK
jgi:hypothetical protein